jgi:TfoX/Sxy family transcriptional regulator of competence genes
VPVNELLVNRIRTILSGHEVTAREQRMFGGIAFMVDDRFAIGTMKDDLVVRIGKEAAEDALTRPGVRAMDFTRRPMPGWIYVSTSVLDEDAALAEWVRMGVAYSATQQPSKPRSRKASQAAAVHPRQPPGTRRL